MLTAGEIEEMRRINAQQRARHDDALLRARGVVPTTADDPVGEPPRTARNSRRRARRDTDSLRLRGIQFRKFNPAEPRDPEGKWSALAGKALETLTRKFGEVLEAERWGDHNDPNGIQGWMTLHADGDVLLSYRTEGGDAKPLLSGPDLSSPDDWRQFADDLREAADAAEAEDEDFEPISASGYDVNIDPADGTVSVDSDRYNDGFVADPDTIRGLADRAGEFADHLERYNDGAYEPKVPDTFEPSGLYSSEMDWSGVDGDGNRSFEVTGDDGETVQMDLSAAEFEGLRAALADFAASGGFFPDEDGRYFDWSSVDKNGRRNVEIGSADGDVTQVGMTEKDMRDWLAALTATLAATTGAPSARSGARSGRRTGGRPRGIVPAAREVDDDPVGELDERPANGGPFACPDPPIRHKGGAGR